MSRVYERASTLECSALKSWDSGIQSPEGGRVDATLIERILSRDASAVGDLYDRHSRMLYGVILRILRNRSEAEEVLQEVFVTVWNRPETYDGAIGSAASWLVRIARNRAIDRLRANTARVRAVESVPFERQSSENPESSASLGEQQRAIARALDAIPREQRARRCRGMLCPVGQPSYVQSPNDCGRFSPRGREHRSRRAADRRRLPCPAHRGSGRRPPRTAALIEPESILLPAP